MGRGKVVVRRIESSTSRQVTFSKRRNGLMKKARELGILCDVEVGVIVFSATGKHYEYASSSIKSVIERYGKHNMKFVEDTQFNASQCENVIQKEVIQMKQEMKYLQYCNRQLMGTDLSTLSLKDLHHLEQLLEMSLHRVREKKHKILIDELEELNRKERLLYEENMKLHKTISKLESSSIARTGMDLCVESMNCSYVQGETSEAAISVRNFSLQLNHEDSSQIYVAKSKDSVVTQLW